MINTTTQLNYRLDLLNAQQERITYQLSTGKKLDNGSEDAAVYTREVYLNDQIRIFEGISDQLDKTVAQNNTSDDTIAEIKNLLDYVRQEVMKGLNAGTDVASREAIAVNLEGVKNNLYMFANEQVEGEYLFAGSNSVIQPFERDSNGKVTYQGDAQLRRVAVEYDEYRDRGVTGFDMMMYSTGEFYTGDTMTFTEDERIVDESGFEWKFIDHDNADGDNDITTGIDTNRMYRYDDEGKLTDEYIRIDDSAAPDYTALDPIGTFYIEGNATPQTASGKVFTPKHLIFDDLDKMINALRDKDENGNPVSTDVAKDLLGAQLENVDAAFDAVNIAHAKLGGRNKVFETATDNISAKITHFNVMQVDVSAADLTQVAVESKQLELTYQALYSTISKMNELSLVNFVR